MICGVCVCELPEQRQEWAQVGMAVTSEESLGKRPIAQALVQCGSGQGNQRIDLLSDECHGQKGLRFGAGKEGLFGLLLLLLLLLWYAAKDQTRWNTESGSHR